MAARLVFHLGYPKTGTTTLQQRVFPRHPELRYLGKLIPGYGYVSDDVTRVISGVTHGDHTWSGDELREVLTRICAEESRPAVLVSTESFIHVDSAPPETVAERLGRTFPDCRLVVCVRRQEDLLASFWRNHGAFGSHLYVQKAEGEGYELPLSFDRWLELNFRRPFKNVLGTLDYDHIVGLYEELLGPDAVSVIPYETMAQDLPRFCRDFAEVLGVSGEQFLALAEGPWENAALTTAAFDRLSKMARNGNALTGEPSAPRTDEPPAAAEMSDRWAKAIVDRFASGNARLAARRNLPLREFGYALNPV